MNDQINNSQSIELESLNLSKYRATTDNSLLGNQPKSRALYRAEDSLDVDVDDDPALGLIDPELNSAYDSKKFELEERQVGPGEYDGFVQPVDDDDF